VFLALRRDARTPMGCLGIVMHVRLEAQARARLVQKRLIAQGEHDDPQAQ
jgi:hypothetical protein